MGRTGHKDTRHIFVASRDNNHTIKPMTAASGLNLVCDEIPRLKGVGHAARSHTDSVTDAYCAELVAYNTSIRERSLGALSQAQQMTIATRKKTLVTRRIQAE